MLGRLYFPVCHDLQAFLTAIVTNLLSCSPPVPVTSLFSSRVTGSASAFLTSLLSSTAKFFGIAIPPATSHCARIACCTTLLELGLSPVQVNHHCGWVVDSKSWSVYNQPG